MMRIFKNRNSRTYRDKKKEDKFSNDFYLETDLRLNKLKCIIENVKPAFRKDITSPQYLQFSFIGKKLDRDALGIDFDEVYPNIYVGNRGSAKSKQFLKLTGITHIVNSADGYGFTMVNTGSHYYSDLNIKYMGLSVLDMPQTKISIHFMETADFIDKALKANGKVLIHCMIGYSRSATIAIAYLMIKKQMSLEDALITLRKKRQVRPNHGFLKQLIDLEFRLKGNRTSFIY